MRRAQKKMAPSRKRWRQVEKDGLKEKKIAPSRKSLHQVEKDCAKQKKLAQSRKRWHQIEKDGAKQKKMAQRRKRWRQIEKDSAKQKKIAARKQIVTYLISLAGCLQLYYQEHKLELSLQILHFAGLSQPRQSSYQYLNINRFFIKKK